MDAPVIEFTFIKPIFDACVFAPSGETCENLGAHYTRIQISFTDDGDGIYDAADDCVNEDSTGFDVDGDGCLDATDGDGTKDDIDVFPNDDKQQTDTDGDGWGDNAGQLNSDLCVNTPSEWVWNVSNGSFGCAWEEGDDDNDGIMNGLDNCPGSNPANQGRPVDSNGCTEWQ